MNKLYDEIRSARQKEDAHFLLLMSMFMLHVNANFNARIGRKTCNDNEYIGNHGLGVKNNRGEMLAGFLNAEYLYCLNTFYKKSPQRKCTWVSPEKTVKNKIGFIMSNSSKICKDVSVIHTGSDHRLVRAHITVNTKLERSKLVKHTVIPQTES